MPDSIFHHYSVIKIIFLMVLIIPKSTSFAQEKSEYLSNDPTVCLQCHPKNNLFSVGGKVGKTHGSTENKMAPFAQEHPCQACHGPSKKHIEIGGNGKQHKTPITFDKNLPATLQNKACLDCHIKGIGSPRHGYGSKFEILSCASCHGVH